MQYHPVMKILALIAIVVGSVGCGNVVTDDDGSFEIATDAGGFVREGDMLELPITVTRNNLGDPITIEVTGLPDGVTAEPTEIEEDATTGTLTLVAASPATQGVAQITVTGHVGDQSSDAAVRLLVGGPPGTPDRSFAGDGTFTTIVPGMVLISRALALSEAGIIVTGSTATQAITARITDAGELDPGFAGSGFVSTGVGMFSEGIAVTTLADNSVLVAGIAGTASTSDNDFGLFKYSAGGVLDTTFGNSGVASFDPGSGFGELHTLVVDGDGSLLVGGVLFGSNQTTRGLRFSSTGVRDTGYDITEANVILESSLLQPDGKLVMAGGLNNDFWLARYLPTGAHDTGFGTGGIVTTDLGANDTAFGLVPAEGGKLLAVGLTSVVTGGATIKRIVLARYNANGSLDLAFGVGGKVTTDVDFDTRSPNAAVVDTEGRILLVGVVGGLPSVARLDPAGTPDPTFGEGGVARVDFGVSGTTTQTGGYGIAIDPDGRILFAGEVGPAGGQNMAVGRLWF